MQESAGDNVRYLYYAFDDTKEFGRTSQMPMLRDQRRNQLFEAKAPTQRGTWGFLHM